MFIAVLFITAPNRKQSNFHPGEWIIHIVRQWNISHKKECLINSFNNLDESQKHYAEKNKPDSILYNHIYMKTNYRQNQPILSRNHTCSV